ncbi:MAG TPA: hypothetical protein VF545_01615 [Thermoleophilaceae bacterium]|jgi:membrane-bound lytic murein transglycosylase B
MPPSTRHVLCIALAIAACIWPAAASAATSGGAAAPTSGTASSVPTGGASPSAPAPKVDRAAKDAPKKKTKKKKRKKKKHRTPRPQPTPVPDNPVPDAGGEGAADIPSEYLRLYRAAGEANGVSWRILAAVGKNESDHGRSTAKGVQSGVNSANCCSGPMQICARASCGNTWAAYAMDGDGDGVESVYSPADSIYAAAALLKNLKGALRRPPRPDHGRVQRRPRQRAALRRGAAVQRDEGLRGQRPRLHGHARAVGETLPGGG